MASTVNVLHVQFSCLICLFFFLFVCLFVCFCCCFFWLFFFYSVQVQRSVSFLFIIISCLFNFTIFFYYYYSEALLWFCYQSKFVERVSWPRGDWFLSERRTLFWFCLSIGHQCVSPAVYSLLSKVPWHAFVGGISYFEFDKSLDTNVFTFFKLKMFIHLCQILTALFFYTQKPGTHFLCYFSIVDKLWFSQH